MKKAETVQPLWFRFLLSTGTNAPSPPRCAPGSLVPVLAINRDQCPLPSLVPVRGPTKTSFSPGLLVPVGQPGLKAPTNRDNRGVCPLVIAFVMFVIACMYFACASLVECVAEGGRTFLGASDRMLQENR